MRSFVSKPVQILGKQFDGTRESAKEITDWVKEVLGNKYQNAELRESVAHFGFSSDVPHSVDAQHVLTIYTESGRYYINRSDWMVLIIDRGDFTTYMNDRLHEIYAEL